MATVNKDFRIKAGLVVEGTTATVDGEDIITTGSTTDNLTEGSSNLYYTTARAKGDAADLLVNATKTNITITGNEDGLTITAENGGIQDLTGFDTDDLTEGATNLYFTNQRALDATASAYDAAGSADSVAGDLSDHTTNNSAHGVLGDVVGTTDSQTLTNKAFTGAVGLGVNGSAIEDTDGDLEVYAAEDLNLVSNGGNVVLSADGSVYKGSSDPSNELTTLGVVNTFIGDGTVDGSTGNTITDRIATAVSNLVDGAPALLDTLNELAAAINDDESFSSTIATQIGGKQNTLTAGTNIDITADTISVTGLSSTDISDFSTAALSATASAYDTAGAASSAETAANGYTDTAISGLSSVYEPIGAAATAVGSLTTDDIEEGENLYFTDSRAVDAITTETIYPPAVVINNVSKQVANAQTVSTASTVSGLAWAKADYRSAKLIVKAETATHSQVSEVMVTLDASDNVAITEFGIVYTDAELATVTADVSGTDVRIRVTTLNASTNVMVVGTLLI
jgi:hypothetical protein